MKALKATIEVPLTGKSHVADMRRVADQVEKFRVDLKEAGFEAFKIDESVVNRPGRG